MTTAMTHDPAAPLVTLFKAEGAKLSAVAAKHLTAERVFRLAVGVFRRTPGLQRCTPASVLDCVMIAARLGLEPDGGALAQAYLVPHGAECTLVVGYRGLIELARRSGLVLRVEARLVHRGDEFDYELGAKPKLKHRPLAEDEGGEVTHAYAVAFFRDGSTQFEVMTAAQIAHVRKSSRSGASGPWAQHAEEMYRKTVVRRLAKYLPLSPELAAGVAMSDQDEETDAKTVKANVRETLDLDPDAVYLKATVEKPRPEVPKRGSIVSDAKAKARSQNAASMPKPDVKPEEALRDAGNAYRTLQAKLAAHMNPESVETFLDTLVDARDRGDEPDEGLSRSVVEVLSKAGKPVEQAEWSGAKPSMLLKLIEARL